MRVGDRIMSPLHALVPLGLAVQTSLRRLRVSAMLAAVAVACIVTLGGAGCVHLEKRAVEDAQAELDACQAEHGVDDPACREKRLALKSAQERYEQAARRAWACDPTQSECPTPR